MYSITINFDHMGRPRNLIPTLRHHKSSGQAFIVWDGKPIYLGHFGTTESVDRFQQTISNIKNYGSPVVAQPEKVLLKTVAERYLADLPNNYPKTSKEPNAIRRSVNDLIRWSKDLPAESFTPARFIELRKTWVDEGRCVTTIAKRHNYILNLFRWAAVNDLLPASVWHSLQALTKMKPKRSAAKDPKIINAVAWADVEAIRPLVSEKVWDMIQLQWLTGMRSGEILAMSQNAIDDNVYRPASHKNAWRGHVREIFLGPRARVIANKYSVGKTPNELLFTGYTNSSYGRAIKRACKRAGIAYWHPHQLRHAAADRARDAFGLDAAQAILGHKTANTTEIYAKVKRSLAKKTSEELG